MIYDEEYYNLTDIEKAKPRRKWIKLTKDVESPMDIGGFWHFKKNEIIEVWVNYITYEGFPECDFNYGCGQRGSLLSDEFEIIVENPDIHLESYLGYPEEPVFDLGLV